MVFQNFCHLKVRLELSLTFFIPSVHATEFGNFMLPVGVALTLPRKKPTLSLRL